MRNILVLIFLFVAAAPVAGQTFEVYDHQNRAVQLLLPHAGHYDTTTFFVFSNETNCANCFKELSGMLDTLATRSTFKYFVIAAIDSNAYKRKIEFNRLKKIFPHASDIYFEYSNLAGLFRQNYKPNGFFTKYNISISPSLLYMHNGECIYLDYFKLFNKDASCTTSVADLLK